MADIPDLQLHHASGSDDVGGDVGRDLLVEGTLDRADQTKWIVLILLSVIAAAVIGYVIIERQRAKTAETAPAPVSAPAPPPAAAAKSGPLVQADNIPLPPLAETDALMRQLVTRLSSHPKVLAWLATNGLINNFTVATLNLSDGTSPVAHWKSLAPQGRFSVLNTSRGTILDPKTYHRYDDYAAAIAALDAPGTARLYLTVKPRIMDAYRDLGYPEGDFDPVLERAMHVLLTTPTVDGEIPVSEKVITYKFVNPDVEALTGAQKQLLRMGPDNMRAVQGKLREIAIQLGLHP